LSLSEIVINLRAAVSLERPDGGLHPAERVLMAGCEYPSKASLMRCSELDGASLAGCGVAALSELTTKKTTISLNDKKPDFMSSSIVDHFA